MPPAPPDMTKDPTQHVVDLDVDVINVPFKVPEEQRAYLSSIGIRANWPARAKKNAHGAAAVERFAAECDMLKAIQVDYPVGDVRVVDIGSNARRRSSASALVSGGRIKSHAQIPLIVPNDAFRQADARSIGAQWCDCTFQTCTHAIGYDVATMVHSLYYVTATDIVEAFLTNGWTSLYAVIHEFNVAGTLSGGCIKYHTDKHGDIRCVADGDNHEYVHSNMAWLAPGSFPCEFDDGPASLIWSRCSPSRGDTHIYRFQIVHATVGCLIPPDASLEDALDTSSTALFGASTALTTAVNRVAVTPNLDVVCVPARRALFYGTTLLLEVQGGEYVPLPRGLASELALLGLGQIRTPALYQTFLARARRILAQMNYPSSMVAEAALYASLAAMVLCVELETIGLGRVSHLHSRLWNAHERALSLRPLRELGVTEVVSIASSAATIGYYTSVGGLGPWLYSGAVFAGTVASMHPLGLMGLGAIAVSAAYDARQRRTAHHSAEALQWASLRNGLVSAPGRRVYHYGKELRFPGALRPKTAPPLAPGAQLRVGGALPARFDTQEDQHGLRAVGVVFCDVGPSYIPKTLESAVSALTTRLLAANPTGHGDWNNSWSSLVDRVGSSESVLHRFATVVMEDHTTVEAWKTWLSRFPPGRHLDLEQARSSLANRSLEKSDLATSGIVKREKTGHVTIDGVTYNDPRVVLGRTQRALAATGPWHWRHASSLRDQFPVVADNFCIWMVSATAEQMGEIFEIWTALFSRPGDPAYYGVGDFARYDCRQGEGSNLFERKTLVVAGAPQDVLFVHDTPPFGSMQGLPIRFKLKKPRRVSGDSATSKGNFTVALPAIVHVFGEPSSSTYGIWDCGDDFLLIGKRHILALTEAEVNSRLAALGLEVTYLATADSAQVEFVSTVPYPTSDGIVFGPKIGRTLSRFGWTTSVGPTNVRSAAIGMTESVSFVPFLCEFMTVHRRLSNDTAAAHRDDRSAVADHESTPETWEFIQRRYGLTRADHEAFCSLLANIESLPAVVPWPRILDVLEADC